MALDPKAVIYHGEKVCGQVIDDTVDYLAEIYEQGGWEVEVPDGDENYEVMIDGKAYSVVFKVIQVDPTTGEEIKQSQEAGS